MDVGKVIERVVSGLILGIIAFSSHVWIPWVFAKSWPRALTIPVGLLLAHSLLARGLWSGMRWGLVDRSRSTVLAIRLATGFLNWLWRSVIVAAVVWTLCMVGALAWNQYRVLSVASGLTWHTAEFYRALCLGMKTAGVTGMPATDVLKYAPNIRMLPRDGQFETRRKALDELQQKGIIENIPPKQVAPGVFVQDVRPTSFGQQVCTYYLTAYKPPKKTTARK